MVTSVLKKVVAILIIVTAFTLHSETAQAEAVLHPNQITGKIHFNNSNPEVLKHLTPPADGRIANRVWLRLDSKEISPPLNNYGWYPMDTPTSTDYEATVDTTETGIAYTTTPIIYMSSMSKRYHFKPLDSAKVLPEPVADTQLSFSECAGVVNVKFVDNNGDPVQVQGGRIKALSKHENYDHYYNTQAEAWRLPAGISEEHLAVRADGETFMLRTFYQSGSDPYKDLVQGECTEMVTPVCDEVIEVECKIAGSTELGSISGTIDILGEEESPNNALTRVWAWWGPFENQRWTKITTNPASGPFKLENLVPTTAVEPEKKYTLWGELGIRKGYRYEYFHTPYLYNSEYYNPSPSVEAGKDTDLGDTFVIDPGFVRGNIELDSPVLPTGSPCVADLSRDADRDYNNDGLPDYYHVYLSSVEANGAWENLGPQELSAIGGHARVGFEGAFNPDSNKFFGDYELVLGGLKKGSSKWNINNLNLSFEDLMTPENPKSYQDSKLRISRLNNQLTSIVPGEVVENDISYCMSEVRLIFRSDSTPFFRPNVQASGEKVNEDNSGYRTNLHYAYGSPQWKEDAKTRGMVVMCLPQGKYNLSPSVNAVNSNGTYNHTELQTVEINIGCKQVVTLCTEIQMELDPYPEKTNQSSYEFSGLVKGSGEVSEITVSHNGATAEIICQNCGKRPPFNYSADLQPGENHFTFQAKDNLGRDASVDALIIYEEPEAPELKISGCSDINVATSPGENSAVASWEISSSGGCAGEKTISCDSDSGANFNVGTTQVNCQVNDSCENTTSCSFNINITATPEEEPEEDPECEHSDIQPVVSCSIGASMLWPPNHKFVDVSLATSAKNSCKKDLDLPELSDLITTSTIWSDETEVPVTGDGSGNTAPDAQFGDVLKLRSERRGTEDGRVYLIISEASNEFDARGFACCTVTVPHDQSSSSKRSVLEQAEAAREYCYANNGSAPDSFTQHGVSAELSGTTKKKRKKKRKRKGIKKSNSSKAKARKQKNKRRKKRRAKRLRRK